MFENWDTLTPIANWPVLSRFKPCLPLPILLLLADSSFSVTIDIYYSRTNWVGSWRKRCFYASKSWPATSTNQLISSTLKTQNYYPIKNHQPLSNTTQQHVQTADLEHGKPKSWFQQQLRRWLWRAGAPVWGGGGYRFVKSERVVVLCCWWVLIELKFCILSLLKINCFTDVVG